MCDGRCSVAAVASGASMSGQAPAHPTVYVGDAVAGGAYSPLPGSDPDQTVAGGIHPNRVVRQKLGRPSNRVVVSLHVVFKLAALIIYLTQTNFIPTFILVSLPNLADLCSLAVTGQCGPGDVTAVSGLLDSEEHLRAAAGGAALLERGGGGERGGGLALRELD